jgi:hypothetical protein
MDERQLPAVSAISGNFRALLARSDNNLRPSATVKLASAKDFVALQMTPTEPGANRYTVFVRNGDNREEERTPLGEIALNESMPFRVALSGKDVEIVAGDQAMSVRQSFRGTANIGLSCTTGHFRFDTLQVQ